MLQPESLPYVFGKSALTGLSKYWHAKRRWKYVPVNSLDGYSCAIKSAGQHIQSRIDSSRIRCALR
jgi:hypothetical protein